MSLYANVYYYICMILPRTRKVGAKVAKTIAIVNQKGGVGKTTTCVNLAAGLHEAGKRVLLCDFDPQANATSGMGVDKTVSKGIYHVVIGEIPAAEAVVHTRYGDVLPSNKALAGAGIELIGMQNREFLLRDALATLQDQYDYIFIDCPPSLELLTLNALCAADTILVPVQGEYYALEGLSDLMNTVRLVRRSLNPKLELDGIVITMVDKRTNLSMDVCAALRRDYGNRIHIYKSEIPISTKTAESPASGYSQLHYDTNGAASNAYRQLAKEVLNNGRKNLRQQHQTSLTR